MATGITTYQCPACTGPLHFAGDSGRLECDYCGASYEVVEIEKLYSEKEAASAAAQEKADAAQEMGMSWSGQEAAGMKSYNCSSCGAELLCDATTAATSCPYCGNPAIVPGQFTGGRKPELVIPFKLDKQAAIQALKAYYRGKKFLPKTFCDKNHIEEIQGVYVPFWLCDCQVSGSVTYHATTSRTWEEDDYEITETDHYLVERSGHVAFERVPVDASSKMPDAHMDSIEPYDYSELRAFSTAYLPGFLADQYDVSQQDCLPRAKVRAQNSAESELRSTVKGYTTVEVKSKALDVSHCQMKYALMPVWMLSTKWNGQNFLFAVNGQTGKLAGDLPVDKGKYWAWFAGIATVMLLIQLGFWFL